MTEADDILKRGLSPPVRGACTQMLMMKDWTGLSPPVRGSRARRDLEPPGLGSIPARAGEPQPSTRPHRRRRVYPRPCGGAPGARFGCVRTGGLSPPVRGSRCESR